MKDSKKTTAIQFAKYAITGVINTLLTLLVIFITKSVLGLNPWLANALGYIAGFINSFFWNRKWVFRSHGKISSEALRFLIAFTVCYALQLAFTWLLTTQTSLERFALVIIPFDFTLSGYGIATLAGMVLYTLANFTINRHLTFKKH